MYQKILLCYDGTIEGRRALRQGADVAMAMNANAYLLAIGRDLVSMSVPEGITSELVTCEQRTAKALLDEGVQWLRDHNVPAEGLLVYGDPLVHIPNVAQKIGADLIVVGYRYRSRFAKWWSESEETRLLDRVSCSILVAAAPPQP